ncbi:MAG: hypothetical protein RJB66_2515 [Pseudomonadota bacterium]|jgi:3-dehydroquinate synthase
MTSIQTRVVYCKTLSEGQILGPSLKTSNGLVIVDKTVFKTNKSVAHWLQQFPFVYVVSGGEQLKDVRHLPGHLEKIFKLLGDHGHRGLTLCAIGGGSVGDFAGFVASIFKRGIDFIQIPSTWLATIDSAHGGKNGLNVGLLKNQIGTFWHPKKVFIVDEVLNSQPESHFNEALGELYKMALITKKPWGRQLIQNKALTKNQIKKLLPLAVAEKYRIVRADPTESKGLRQFLNLGHTFGHVIELEQKIPHGRAVSIGLKFALDLSFEMGFIKKNAWKALQSSAFYQELDTINFKTLSEKTFRLALSHDKKKDSAESIKFVFLQGLGRPVVKSITINELIAAGKKHGFIHKPSR